MEPILQIMSFNDGFGIYHLNAVVKMFASFLDSVLTPVKWVYIL